MSDLDEQTALLKQHEGFIALNARHWLRFHPYLAFEDLRQEGRLALLKAHGRNDGRGKLLSFAQPFIQRAMRDHALAFGLPVKMPRQRGRIVREVQRVALDAPLFDDSAKTLAEVLTAPVAEVELSKMEDLTALVETALMKLKPREREVLKARFMEGRKLCEIGQDYGLSRERIRQIENKALRVLRADRNLKRA